MDPTTLGLSPEALCRPKVRIEKVAAEVEHLATQIRNSQDNHMAMFEIIIGDTGLRQGELQAVINKFIDAGWAGVETYTSGERGERGGLRVYKFSKLET